jgi:hypothetical protein
VSNLSNRYTSIWIDDGEFGGNTRSIQYVGFRGRIVANARNKITTANPRMFSNSCRRYNTDDNLTTAADPDIMSEDDFDDDDAPSGDPRNHPHKTSNP